MKGERATVDYIAELSQEQIQQQRSDILNASVRELNALAEPIKEAMAAGYCCVIGSESQINRDKNIFARVETLL